MYLMNICFCFRSKEKKLLQPSWNIGLLRQHWTI